MMKLLVQNPFNSQLLILTVFCSPFDCRNRRGPRSWGRPVMCFPMVWDGGSTCYPRDGYGPNMVKVVIGVWRWQYPIWYSYKKNKSKSILLLPYSWVMIPVSSCFACWISHFVSFLAYMPSGTFKDFLINDSFIILFYLWIVLLSQSTSCDNHCRLFGQPQSCFSDKI